MDEVGAFLHLLLAIVFLIGLRFQYHVTKILEILLHQ